MAKNGVMVYNCVTYTDAQNRNGWRERACKRCPLYDGCPKEGQVPLVTCPSCGAALEPVFVEFEGVLHSWETVLRSYISRRMDMTLSEINHLAKSSCLIGFECPSCADT